MTFRYAVTFEYDEAAPDTLRGEILCGKAETACFRAVKAAKARKPNTRFRSLVVLVERLDTTAEADTDTDHVAEETP